MGSFDDLIPQTGSDSFGDLVPIKLGAESFGDTLRGELQGKDWLTRNIIGAGSALTSAAEGIKGLFGNTNQQNVASSKIIGEEAPIGRIAGEVAMLAPTLAIPGAASVRGAAAIGGLTGGVLTPGDWKERAMAAGLGAAGGAAGAALSRGAAARPSFESSTDVRTMLNEGVSLTPGQNIGGFVGKIEDRLTSAPFVGDIIESAKRRGVEDFNRAALRRAELPGVASSGGAIGHQGVANLRHDLSAAYDDVLSRSQANALEPQFVQNLTNLRSMVSGLPQREAEAFDRIIARELDSRLAPNGVISGGNLQAAQSSIGQQASNFSRSTDAYQRELGMALRQADEELRALVQRSSPQNAAELEAINRAYANFKKLQSAASSPAAAEGVFSPTQLHQAVRSGDRTKDKRAFSEGTALMQDLSMAGKNTLPSKVPDSGTAGRLMGSIFNPLAFPGMAAGAALSVPLSMLYTRTGQQAANALVNRGIRPSAEAIRNLLAANTALAGVTAGRLSELAGQQ